jgi:hypothetical protein
MTGDREIPNVQRVLGEREAAKNPVRIHLKS